MTDWSWFSFVVGGCVGLLVMWFAVVLSGALAEARKEGPWW
jgi:uncharacterized membrane protein YdcZ (DUF606 family)